MSISTKARKLLWGKSGNKYAICKVDLYVEKTQKDDESIVGEECHIVSEKNNGPRYRENYPTNELDEYNNLILLCNIHHKMIDDQFETYTEEIVRLIKEEHEKWVKSRLMHDQPKKRQVEIKRKEENIPKRLERTYDGKELSNLIQDVCAFYYDYDNEMDEQQIGIAVDFFSLIDEYGLISDVMSISDKINYNKQFTDLINRLDEMGYWVFASREEQYIFVDGIEDDMWPVCHIQIVSKNSKIIFTE